MIGGNRIALEKIVADIEIRVTGVDILAESITERKNECSAISSLILDDLAEIRQLLGDVGTLIHCEEKGVVIDA